jgi:hypothetical protein
LRRLVLERSEAVCRYQALTSLTARRLRRRKSAGKGAMAESTEKRATRTKPGWSDVKARLASFNRAELLALVQSLYAASRDNQAFLHARLDLGSDPIAPYKETISRWVHPDVYKGQDYSISKAKKAISDYKKAIGGPDGMAELTVHFCEEAIAFANAYGLDDESFYDALVRMFRQAVTHALALPEAGRELFLERLGKVMAVGQDMGWGVGDAFADTWAEAGLDA